MSAEAARRSKVFKAKWFRVGLWHWWVRNFIGSGPVGLELSVMMFNSACPMFAVTAQEVKDCPAGICRRWTRNAREKFERAHGFPIPQGYKRNHRQSGPALGSGWGVRPRAEAIMYVVAPRQNVPAFTPVKPM